MMLPTAPASAVQPLTETTGGRTAVCLEQTLLVLIPSMQRAPPAPNARALRGGVRSPTGNQAIYLVLLGLLWGYGRRHPDTVSMSDALRLLPDALRLIRRLVADRSLPAGVRIRLVLLLIYLASPIDLVPDFIPVVGYADDAIVIALVLRSVARRAGPEAIERHWPGTPQGLELKQYLVHGRAANH